MRRKRQLVGASITVEAALVLPIFIFAIYTFLHFFCILQFQDDLHAAASDVCEMISSYGGILQDVLEEDADPEEEQDFADVVLDQVKDEVIDATTMRLLVYTKLKHSGLVKRCVKNGYTGISFLGSSLSDSNDCATVKMSYEIRIPIVGSSILSFPVTQKVSIRNFTGHYVASRLTEVKKGEDGEDEEEDPIVYVTKNGSVYHLSSSCTYIKRQVSEVFTSQIEEKRNQNGGKYYPCESCIGKGDKPMTALVYITPYGNRYHVSSNCSQIERTVIEKHLSEVAGMRPCSKCGK